MWVIWRTLRKVPLVLVIEVTFRILQSLAGEQILLTALFRSESAAGSRAWSVSTDNWSLFPNRSTTISRSETDCDSDTDSDPGKVD